MPHLEQIGKLGNSVNNMREKIKENTELPKKSFS